MGCEGEAAASDESLRSGGDTDLEDCLSLTPDLREGPTARLSPPICGSKLFGRKHLMS
jgi:hypothetical protein